MHTSEKLWNSVIVCRFYVDKELHQALESKGGIQKMVVEMVVDDD